MPNFKMKTWVNLVTVLFLISFSKAELICRYEIIDSYTISCYNIGFERLVLDYPRNIEDDANWGQAERLCLANNDIADMKSTAFTKVANIKHLDLSGNRIHTLRKDMFQHFKGLISLNMSFNLLSVIETEAFGEILNLRELDLSYNLLSTTSFEGETISMLKNLRYLDISGNVAIDIREIRVGPSVANLKASEAGTIGPQTFKGATGLTNLVLSKSQISRIYPNMFIDCGEVNILDLSQNEIHTIANNAISKLTKLIYLFLGHNKLTSLTDSKIFSSNVNLRILDLSHNQITSISNQMFESNKLLVSLILSSNRLTMLSSRVLLPLQKLRSLDLSSNNLRTVSDIFANNVNLITLSLSGNALKEISPGTFGSLINVRFLDLEKNGLEVLPMEIVTNMKSLEVLNLHNNHLTRLPEKLLQMKTLSRLLVSCNRLTVLSPNFFKLPLDGLSKDVNLHGNPWKCSCMLDYLDDAKLNFVKISSALLGDGQVPVCIHEGNLFSCDSQPLTKLAIDSWLNTMTSYYRDICA